MPANVRRDAPPRPDVALLPGLTSADVSLLAGKPLAPLAAYIGDWEVSAFWSGGQHVWARNEYRVLMNGAFVLASTWVSDAGGEPYLRYQTMYAWDAARGAIVGHGFTNDGTTETLVFTQEADEAGAPLALVTEWASGQDGSGPVVRQRTAIPSPADETYAWQVWFLSPSGEAAVAVMDDVWRRVPARRDDAAPGAGPRPGASAVPAAGGPPAGPYAVDAALFAASGADLRSFTKTATINGSPAAVFETLTTAEGLRRVMGIDSTVQLAVGGAYEWYFLPNEPYGRQGGEGCQVLAYVPGRVLAFSWNAPPTQPEQRAKRTWVVIELAASGGGATTVLTVTHLGFGEGAEWDKTMAYFDRAWPTVLEALARSFGE